MAIGMDERTRQRLPGTLSFSTKAKRGGTGLGLAMVYGMMQRHEGTIEIEKRARPRQQGLPDVSPSRTHFQKPSPPRRRRLNNGGRSASCALMTNRKFQKLLSELPLDV